MTNTPDDDVDQDSGPSTKAPDDARPDLPAAGGESESSESGSVGGDTGTGDTGSTSQ